MAFLFRGAIPDRTTDEPVRRIPTRTAARDGGFTLVEVVVALVIGVIVMVAIVMTMAGSLRSARNNRTVEQATALAIEQVEFARSLTWDELAMDSNGVGDSRIVNPGPELIGSTVGLPANEPLAVDVAAGLVPYETTETLNDQSFSVFNYVTDVEPGLRRLVVVVEWEIGGALRQHQTTTLISEVSLG